MIELVLTSFPFVLRVLYLRWRGRAVTLYNVFWAVFLWLVLALLVFFAVFYWHPKSTQGMVLFRIVPVVAEQGGTVTSVAVTGGQRVAAGDVLFTTSSEDERAAVAVAERQLAEIDALLLAAAADVRAARATQAQAEAELTQADQQLADQQDLRDRRSAAYRANEYERIVNVKAGREAEVAAAQAAIDSAELQLAEVLPARRATAAATLDQGRVALDRTTVRAGIAGVVEQLTLTAGARAGQTNLGPAMLIVPDMDAVVVAGFAQEARSVLHVGMAAEIACMSNLNVSMTNAVLPARVARIQNVVAAGQLAPTGLLIEPVDIVDAGTVVVHFALVYPEHRALLVSGSNCMVQTYTTHLEGGPLEGGILAHGIEALGALKAILLRVKLWIALATGIGLGGGGH